jgi:hypothetical protein
VARLDFLHDEPPVPPDRRGKSAVYFNAQFLAAASACWMPARSAGSCCGVCRQPPGHPPPHARARVLLDQIGAFTMTSSVITSGHGTDFEAAAIR